MMVMVVVMMVVRFDGVLYGGSSVVNVIGAAVMVLVVSF